jgi:endonuclease YncB( thermonuclease family)
MKRQITLSVLVAVALALVALPSFAIDNFSGKVRSVQDGDTLVVNTRGVWVKVTLAGLLTPTRNQEHGREARDYLAQIALKKEATVEVQNTRVDGVYIAVVTVDGRDLSTAMIEAGYGWPTDSANQQQLAAAEKGRESGQGVYSDS